MIILRFRWKNIIIFPLILFLDGFVYTDGCKDHSVGNWIRRNWSSSWECRRVSLNLFLVLGLHFVTKFPPFLHYIDCFLLLRQVKSLEEEVNMVGINLRSLENSETQVNWLKRIVILFAQWHLNFFLLVMEDWIA